MDHFFKTIVDDSLIPIFALLSLPIFGLQVKIPVHILLKWGSSEDRRSSQRPAAVRADALLSSSHWHTHLHSLVSLICTGSLFHPASDHRNSTLG